MIPLLLSGIIGMAAYGLPSTDPGGKSSPRSEGLGVGGTAAYHVLSELKDKDYFSTEEAMMLLHLSKPTILRRFKEWQNDPDSPDGIAYEGQGGRGGFRVSRDAVQKYAETHGISLDWGRLVTFQLEKQTEETARVTGVSQEDQTLQKIELDKILLERTRLEADYLELELQEEKDPARKTSLRKKVLKTKMHIKNIEYDIKVLEFSLDNASRRFKGL